jgi:hypothetical protein
MTTLGALTLVDDTSIEDNRSNKLQLVTINRLKEVIKRIDANNIGLEARVKDIRIIKVKMPLIKRFNGLRNKLKGFLI